MEPPSRKVLKQEVILMAIQRWTPLANLQRMDNDMYRIWPHFFRSFAPMHHARHVSGGVPIDAFFTEETLWL